MHICPSRAVVATAVATLLLASPTLQGTKAGDPFAILTVDSIMRGPKLVGYPQTGLRWSGDSKRLYFEWRRPADDEAATYVVAADGSEPRRLSDEERRNAPPANGAVWDRAHRRVLFVDKGDIVLVDTVDNSRVQITRTTATEAHPRWARHEQAVTFTRDNNLYLVTVGSGGSRGSDRSRGSDGSDGSRGSDGSGGLVHGSS